MYNNQKDKNYSFFRVNNKILDMKQDSLQNSPNQKSQNERISDNILIKDHIDKRTDKIIQQLEDLLKDENPATRHQKLFSKNCQELIKLRQQNRQLLQKNRELLQQNRKLKKQSSPQHNSNHNESIDAQQAQQAQSSKSSEIDEQIKGKMTEFGCKDQRQLLQKIFQMQNHAKLVSKQVENDIATFQDFISIFLDKIIIKFDLHKFNENLKRQQQAQLSQNILVNKDLYKKLLEYYCETVSFPIIKFLQNSEASSKDQLQRQIITNVFKSGENKNSGLHQKTLQALEKPQEIECFFSNLAQKAGCSGKWDQYLLKNKEQSVKFKQQIDQITKGKDQHSLKQKQKQNERIIKDNSLLLSSSQKIDQSTIISNIEVAEDQIQDILFEKLKKIVEKLQFSKKQKQLFSYVNQNRQSGRLNSLENLLNKFKDKEDVVEISRQFSLHMIKSINLLMLRVMQMLKPDSQKYESDEWFIEKLQKKSQEVKAGLQKQIEKNCNDYLKNFKKDKKNLNKIFGKASYDKELEIKIIEVVEGYRRILADSILFCNRQINIKLL